MTAPLYPPGPHPLRLLHLYAASRGNTLRFMERLARRYGDITHVRLGGKHYYLLTHPDHIEEILMAGDKVKRSIPMPMKRALGDGLICSSGDHHQQARAIVQAFFHNQSAHEMETTILGYAQQRMQQWADGNVRDIEEEMIQLTLGIILKTVFGTDFGNAIQAVAASTGVIHENGHATLRAVVNTWLEQLPLIGRYTPLGIARRHLDKTIEQLIRTRREEESLEGKDLVSMLLRLRVQGSAKSRKFVTEQVLIRDEVITLLTAGHETTSSALAWTWHLLGQHPDAEQALHDELETVLEGRRPRVEDLPKLRYTRMVFSESMRLYPPVWAAARRVMTPLTIGGYPLPQGAFVYFTQYLVHRDARFHRDPDRFLPERFAPGEQATWPKYAYFPFGGGNRQCVGESMAWMEGLLLLATLGQQWRFRPVADHPIEMDPLIALQPKFGIRMIFEQRRTASCLDEEASKTHGAAV